MDFWCLIPYKFPPFLPINPLHIDIIVKGMKIWMELNLSIDISKQFIQSRLESTSKLVLVDVYLLGFLFQKLPSLHSDSVFIFRTSFIP